MSTKSKVVLAVAIFLALAALVQFLVFGFAVVRQNGSENQQLPTTLNISLEKPTTTTEKVLESKSNYKFKIVEMSRWDLWISQISFF